MFNTITPSAASRRAEETTLKLLRGFDELLKQHKAQIEADAAALERAGQDGPAHDIRSEHLGGSIFGTPTVAGALRSIVDGALDGLTPSDVSALERAA